MPEITIPDPQQVARERPTDQNYIEAKALHMPNIDPMYYHRYGDEGALMLGLFRTLGRYLPTSNLTFIHYEAPRSFQGFAIEGAFAGGAVGATVTLTVAGTSHSDSGETSRPMEREIILFPNNVTGIILSKDTTTPGAHTVEVAPLLADASIPALAAGSFLVLSNNAYGEGTFAPTPVLEETPIRVEGCTQILKRSYSITGSELNSVSWIHIEKGGELADIYGSGFKWFLRSDWLTYLNFMKDSEMALLTNNQATNPTVLGLDSEFGQFHTTEGLLPHIRRYGINPAAYTAGSYNIFNLQNLGNLLDEEGGAMEYLVLSGNHWRNEFDNFITDTFKEGAITYNAFSGLGDSGKDRAVRYGFDSVHVSNYTWHIRKYPMFHHPNLLGAANYNYHGDFFAMPMDVKQDALRADKQIPSIAIRYRANGGAGHDHVSNPLTYNREIEQHYTGSAFPGRKWVSDTQDVARVHYRAEMGLEVYAANRFIYQARA